MKSLFVKEFRQGRSLLIFAAVMALLIPVCYLVLARAAFLYIAGYDAAWLPVIAGFALLGLSFFIAIFASAGLFCSEAHRGTLPILFALPLSRGRIWLAKLLAGLTLTIVASLLVLVVGGALLPGPCGDLPVRDHLADLCCSIIFLFAVGAFCSSLSRSVNAAIPATVLLAGAIIAGGATLRFYYGAPLLGPPWLDVALWCACTSPALLLGSLLVVVRGELLQSARKWLFGVPPVLLATGLIVLLVIGVARATTRYHRSNVSEVSQVSDPNGGEGVCLLSHGQPFQVVPRWLLSLMVNDESIHPGALDLDQLQRAYRANHTVVLDLVSGRERSLARFPMDYQDWTHPSPPVSAACSRDGRLAAIITQPAGLTWGVRQNRPLKLQIVEIERKKLLYSGWPEKAPSDIYDRHFDLSWSPSGEHLVLSSGSYGGMGGDKRTMYFLNKDGSQSRSGPLILRSPGWALKEDMIYGFDSNDNLCRAYPDDRPTEIIWAPQPKPEGVERSLSPQALSPDGKSFALLEAMWPEKPEPGARRSVIQTLHLIPTAGGPSEVIWQGVSSPPTLQDAAWSGTNRFLYLVMHSWHEPSRRPFHCLLSLDRESHEITQIGPEVAYGPIALIPRPRSDQIVLWCLEYDWKHEGWPGPRLLGGHLALADPDGWRPLPSAEESSRFAMEHGPIGFDHRGRLILLRREQSTRLREEPFYALHDRLEALDLDTGEVEKIYP